MTSSMLIFANRRHPCPGSRKRVSGPRDSLVRLSHGAAAAGLVIASCGNASVRKGPDRFLVTASGSQLADLGGGDLSEVSLEGKHLEGPRPSIEADLHRLVFKARPKAQAVLHCHAQWATLMACLQVPQRDLDFIIEVPAYIGQHEYVPYLPPGSRELAEAVADALADPRVTVVQLTNHGQVAVGATWQEALIRLVYFERACWMALQSQPLKRIPKNLGASPTSPF